jgi:hypothetical protein
MRKQESILEDVFLQPWFFSFETAHVIRKLIPGAHRRKMLAYFEDYGCMRCGKSEVRYGSNGMCKVCVQNVKLKMLLAIKRRWKPSEQEMPPRTFSRAAQARELLADLRPKFYRQSCSTVRQ